MQQRARDLLAGRLVVVTGASAGIGRAFVESVASPGTRFVLVARRRPELESLAEAVWARGGEAPVQAVDLRDPGRQGTAPRTGLRCHAEKHQGRRPLTGPATSQELGGEYSQMPLYRGHATVSSP
ncbi:SDR family NAD(P)-dependent oxidoreductase [Tessaracoccus massiliensis]|uniref:SDR family NAD(P)-dependent oxidoreductase n=1 Tax=Tessaracoccus massiliensis TaxID=1522311 RepID=UPI00058CA0C4